MTTTPGPEPHTTEVVLEVLYLDAQTCDPCRSTNDAVDVAAAQLAERLRALGRTLTVRKVHVTDPAEAAEHGFVSSPTVRVDGWDIELDVHEQLCGTCSALAGERIDCRTFEWAGARHPSPPAEMITTRVMQHLAGRMPVAPPPSTAAMTSVNRFLAARTGR